MRGLLAMFAAAGCAAPEPPVLDDFPVIPVGYDAYLRWDELPRIHLGDRAYMRSTYDRGGGNEGVDASHFIREAGDGTFVTLDVGGSGALVFARANHWHGSPWHWTVDGIDHVIGETSTATPDAPVAGSTFLPADALPSPLAETWSTTHGADLSWVPVPFTRSLTLADQRTHYGTGYFIYHLYPQGEDHLSAPIGGWAEQPPPVAVLDLLGRAGSDIAPPGDEHDATVDVPAGRAVSALSLVGPAAIRRLAIDAPVAEAAALAELHLVVAWDGAAPSIDAPLGLLFGAGTFHDRDGKGAIVRALLASVTIDADRVRAVLYFPMPFHATAQISLAGVGTPVTGVHIAARTVADATPAAWQGYFHATYVDHGSPVPGQDLVALDTRTVEGGIDWCGSFVGMAFTFSDRADLSTLEGDPRMFFDDAESPQGHGTGTEEWAGGGDYWGGQTMTLPLAGHPTGAPSLADAQSAEDAIESAYRFLIADAMPFGKNARIQLEHGGLDESTEHYRTVTYWYGRPATCLVRSDTLQIGDPADEAAHGYHSPTASAAAAVTARLDGLGVDTGDPPSTDIARTMTGTSAFTIALAPANRGALLRRRLDYAIPDQAAEVWIAADERSSFRFAGIWYLAGSTTSLYSNPPGELDAPAVVVETSDRRWRDDEFVVPRALTEHRSSVRVELRFVPAATPLMPDTAPGARAWSEVRYQVYSYVL
jgi:hypothetical protein